MARRLSLGVALALLCVLAPGHAAPPPSESDMLGSSEFHARYNFSEVHSDVPFGLLVTLEPSMPHGETAVVALAFRLVGDHYEWRLTGLSYESRVRFNLPAGHWLFVTAWASSGPQTLHHTLSSARGEILPLASGGGSAQMALYRMYEIEQGEYAEIIFGAERSVGSSPVPSMDLLSIASTVGGDAALMYSEFVVFAEEGRGAVVLTWERDGLVTGTAAPLISDTGTGITAIGVEMRSGTSELRAEIYHDALAGELIYTHLAVPGLGDLYDIAHRDNVASPFPLPIP